MKGLIQWCFVLCFLFLTFHFQVDCSLSSFSFNSSSTPTKLCPHDQSFALIQFSNSFSIDCNVSDDCQGYPSKTISWKEGTNCCLWDGIKCDTETGNVIGLDLSCSCLSGTIPSNSSLFLLHHLHELNLAYNDFNSSPIASEFGQFTSLTHLNFSVSGFSGIIPVAISQLSKLEMFDLSYNDLRFERHGFEKLLGNLTQLRDLLLSGIDMSLVVPTSFLNMSSSITTLALWDNGLRGKFPEDVFRFPYLQELSLTDNSYLEVSFPKTNWSGPLKSLEVSNPSSFRELPDSIGTLRSLQVLDLSYCNLKGSIPASLGNLTRLNHLDLTRNNLVGQIPDAFGNLNKLSHLSLSNNELRGLLPFSAFNLTQIETLDFSENKLVGHVPYHVGGLSRLSILSLDQNFLYGRIPSWLFTLPSLILLDLSYNNLTGPIDHFENAAPLEVVYLQNNEIQGPIPSSIFELVNLTNLDLSSNKLNGIFESAKLSKLNQLQELYLSNNAFLSISGGSNANYTLPNLSRLGISSCNISEFPDFVRNLEGLHYLNLSHNRIRVIEADMFSKLKSLQTLDLSHNSIQGQISKQETNWGKSLAYLDLSNNFLTGLEYYPSNVEILQLGSNLLEGPLLVPPPSTMVFLISKNKLVGDIPSSICKSIMSIEILDLSNNSLSGAIPECLGKLDDLYVLDLQMNRFHGNIPDSFVKGNSLLTLNLNNNDFDGPLPKSLVNCQHLEVLNLGNNKINDTFPHWLGTLPHLKVLVLRSNHFHDGIIQSENGSHFSTLRILDLSHNEFSGLLPETFFKSFESMMNLSSFELGYMGDNLENDPDSVVIKKKGVDIEFERILITFVTINLSSNKFEGKIPELVGKLNLHFLDLQMNKFYGNIPDSFVKGSSLRTLNLNSNDFDGPLPKSLVNCQDLEVLNLGNNKINDTFPNWLGTLPQLQVLVLRSNYFHGRIIQSENGSHFSTLRILDLSHNEFSGFLSKTFFKSFESMMNLSNIQMGYIGANLSSYYQDSVVVTMKGVDIEFERILNIFATIDLSSNKFEGKIPEIVGKLASLQVLNFSHNRLTGHIPSSFGNLVAIESLDLSSNKLVGQIPMQLTDLNSLAVLNLSQNQLVGPIPQGKQFNTFLNDSYDGNLGLCGFPVSKGCGKEGAQEPATPDEEDGSSFGLDWKFVMMGYGCGLAFGISAGYIMMTIGKPKWLVRRVQRVGYKVLRRLGRYHWE